MRRFLRRSAAAAALVMIVMGLVAAELSIVRTISDRAEAVREDAAAYADINEVAIRMAIMSAIGDVVVAVYGASLIARGDFD